MSHSTQCSSTDNKIRSAIDLLLSSDSVEVDNPNIDITRCDPMVDVVMNKQGGICTKCNILFESRAFLLNHLKQCHGCDVENSNNNLENNNGHENNDKIHEIKKPRLLIVTN